MKNVNIFLCSISILATGILLSCSDTTDDTVQGMVSLNLQAPCIEPAASTRHSPIDGSFFPWKNTLGLYQTNNKEGDYYYYTDHKIGFCVYEGSAPHLNGYDNLQTVLRSKYYPKVKYEQEWLELINARIGRTIKVYAYHPWQYGTFPPDNMPFTTTEQKDWMWADTFSLTVNSESSSNSVPLKFHHAMTCLEIRLSTRYNSTIDLYQITLSDKEGKLVEKGWIDLNNGKIKINEDEYTSQITISASKDLERLPIHNTSDDYLSYCFLIPEKSFNAGDLTLTFWYDNNKTPVTSRATFTVPVEYKKSDGSSYQPKNAEGLHTLKRGERYILNLIIDNATTIEALDIQADENWEDKTIDVIVT